MTTGSTIRGPWPARDDEELVLTESPTGEPEQAWYYAEEEAEKPRLWGRTLIKTLCATSAIAWVAFSGWTQYIAWGGSLPTAQQAASFIPSFSTPLLLIGLVWMLASRSVKAETESITKTILDLRAEEARFGLIIDSFANKLSESRAAIVEQNDLLMQLGHESAQKMAQISDAMRVEVDGIAKNSATLKSSAASARADMAVLLADLPRANVQTRQITVALQQAGLAAQDHAASLDGSLAQLTERGKEADEIASGAAQKLAIHLARMEGMSETAGAQMTEAATAMTEAVDGALARAAEALASSRQGLEAQGSAMLAMIEQGQAAMARMGAESAETINQRMTEISARIDMIAQSFNEQDNLSQSMLDRISGEIARIETSMADLDQGARTTSETASSALGAVDQRVAALSASLEAGRDTVDAMIARSEALLTALDATAREIDETLPASHNRFVEVSQQAAQAAQSIAPQFELIESSSANAMARLAEAEAMLRAQQQNMDAMLIAADSRMAESKSHSESLVQNLAEFEQRAETLAATTGPQMIEALLRVKETAQQAAEHARAAISDVIPQTAETLGEKSREALTAALTAQVEEQVNDISRTTEAAVKSAQKATDRLMRQMLTISETTAALEARVLEAKEEVTRSDEGAFARRVALLIESLNSTAIDVTKILSNEVTDTAWAAYLRGDRGVFTRRAVRLLDAGEVREIARYYDEDMEFREQVNRYIHDFEGMLRHVLASRDGGPLSVTLLSSDAGKLYVALAQAIDRLRT